MSTGDEEFSIHKLTGHLEAIERMKIVLVIRISYSFSHEYDSR